jgi:hypothetical protein
VPEVVSPPRIATPSLETEAVGALDRFAVVEVSTLVIVAPKGMSVPETTAPTSVLLKVPDPLRMVISGLVVLTLAVTLCCEVMEQALVPLLQNSVTGDGHGCSVLLRPLAIAVEDTRELYAIST